MLIIGKEEAIDDAIKSIARSFSSEGSNEFWKDYLGVQIVQSDDGKKAWLGQPNNY